MVVDWWQWLCGGGSRGTSEKKLREKYIGRGGLAEENTTNGETRGEQRVGNRTDSPRLPIEIQRDKGVDRGERITVTAKAAWSLTIGLACPCLVWRTGASATARPIFYPPSRVSVGGERISPRRQPARHGHGWLGPPAPPPRCSASTADARYVRSDAVSPRQPSKSPAYLCGFPRPGKALLPRMATHAWSRGASQPGVGLGARCAFLFLCLVSPVRAVLCTDGWNVSGRPVCRFLPVCCASAICHVKLGWIG